VAEHPPEAVERERQHLLLQQLRPAVAQQLLELRRCWRVLEILLERLRAERIPIEPCVPRHPRPADQQRHPKRDGRIAQKQPPIERRGFRRGSRPGALATAYRLPSTA